MNRFKIFEVEADKANHFFYGVIITIMLFVILKSEVTAFGICTIIAFTKEVYDHFFGSRFDWMDIVWTLLGAGVIFIRFL
jgi:hypothetical protein